MDAFRAGIQAIGRNGPILFAYIAVSIVLSLAMGGLEALFLSGPLKEVEDTVKRLVDVFKLIGIAAVYAGLNSIAFSLFGADIDRPLWRYHGWQDSLRRFFTPWFLLAMTYIVLFRLIVWFGQDHTASQFFLTMACITFTLHLPVGIAIMHQGRFEWRYLGDALTPLLIQLPRMIIPIILGLYLFFFSLFAGENVRPGEEGSLGWIWRAALFEAMAGLFVFVIAATTWCALMLHRDESDEDFDI